MAYNSSKLATLPRRLAAHLLLAEIQAEARLARAIDDDEPRVNSVVTVTQ
jgi:Na+-translocating ferredoxin:NAD+ oxidoreductase RnfC subunit